MNSIKELLKRAIGQSDNPPPKHRKDDWDGIPELMVGRITNDVFLQRNGIAKIEEVLKERLIVAYDQRDAASTETLIYLIFKFEVFGNEDYVSILNKLLLSDWHYQHENIALLLEKISCFDSVKCLYDAIHRHPSYLSEDENCAFEVKCVRAIYYIGKEKSVSYLEKLSTHENDIVRETAQRQLKKLK